MLSEALQGLWIKKITKKKDEGLNLLGTQSFNNIKSTLSAMTVHQWIRTGQPCIANIQIGSCIDHSAALLSTKMK